MSDLLKRFVGLSPEKQELLLLRLSKSKEEASQAPIVAQKRDSYSFPLSFAQQRLWFLDQLEPGSAVYNILAAVHLAGSLDVAVFQRSLSEIVRRHETLRTTFTFVEGQPVQLIAPARADAPALPLLDLGVLSASAWEAEIPRLA